MPQFGICGPIEITPAAKAAGWDYLEFNAQALLQGDVDDAAWTGPALVKQSALPIPALNVFLPGDLKIVGPTIDQPRIERYLGRVFSRARTLGIETIVFGSGVARKIPEGFDVDRAHGQVVAFTTQVARAAEGSGVTVVVEHLNRGETNYCNTLAHGADLVRAVNRPAVRLLVDSFHFWLEKEPLASLDAAMPLIRHVHVADEVGRVTPGESGQSDYRAFFKIIRQHGYVGRISVEAGGFTPAKFETCLAFLKDQWATA